MKKIDLKLKDACIIRPMIRIDPRGTFFEAFNESDFLKLGIDHDWVQDNQSVSSENVFRGLHFQLPPKAQAKLVRVTCGMVIDIIVDLRKDSPTYLRQEKILLDCEDSDILYVPEGFAHGFLSLTEGASVVYKAGDYYDPKLERSILWEDEDFSNVKLWLSDKDENAMSLKEFLKDNPF